MSEDVGNWLVYSFRAGQYRSVQARCIKHEMSMRRSNNQLTPLSLVLEHSSFPARLPRADCSSAVLSVDPAYSNTFPLSRIPCYTGATLNTIYRMIIGFALWAIRPDYWQE